MAAAVRRHRFERFVLLSVKLVLYVCVRMCEIVCTSSISVCVCECNSMYSVSEAKVLSLDCERKEDGYILNDYVN